MAILETKTLVEEGIANAYASAENKGATIPEQKNIKNLAETIESIQGGGSGTLGATIVDYPFEVAYDTIVYTFASSSDDVFVSASGGKGLYKFNKGTKAFELLVADWTCMEFFEDSRGNVFFSGTNLGQNPSSTGSSGNKTYWIKKSSLAFSEFGLEAYKTNFIETETYLYCQSRATVNDLTKHAFNYETEEMSQVVGISGNYLKYKDQNGYVYAFGNGFEIIEGTTATSLGIAPYYSINLSIHETSDGKIIFIYQTSSSSSWYVILVDPVNKTYTSIGTFAYSYRTHRIEEYNGNVFGYFFVSDDKRLTSSTGIIRRFDFENNTLVEAYSGTSACVLQTLITPMNEYFAFGNQGSKFILKYNNETNLFVRLATNGTAPISYVMFDNGDFVYTKFTGGLYKYTQSTNAVTSLIGSSLGEYVAYKSNEYMVFCNVDINRIMSSSTVINETFGIYVAPVTATGYADFSNFITSGGYFVSSEDENHIYFDNAQLAKRVRFNKADKTFSELEVKSTNPMKDYNVSVPHYDSEPSVLFNADNESMLLDDKYTVAINKENVGVAVSKKKLIMV